MLVWLPGRCRVRYVLGQDVAGYIAYYGAYEVDEANGQVTHQVVGALFPNWIGDIQTRNFEFEGDRLRLSTQPIKGRTADLTNILLWERV